MHSQTCYGLSSRPPCAGSVVVLNGNAQIAGRVVHHDNQMILPVRPDGVAGNGEKKILLIVDRIIRAVEVAVICLAQRLVADHSALAPHPPVIGYKLDTGSPADVALALGRRYTLRARGCLPHIHADL